MAQLRTANKRRKRVNARALDYKQTSSVAAASPKPSTDEPTKA